MTGPPSLKKIENYTCNDNMYGRNILKTDNNEKNKHVRFSGWNPNPPYSDQRRAAAPCTPRVWAHGPMGQWAHGAHGGTPWGVWILTTGATKTWCGCSELSRWHMDKFSEMTQKWYQNGRKLEIVIPNSVVWVRLSRFWGRNGRPIYEIYTNGRKRDIYIYICAYIYMCIYIYIHIYI